MRELRFKTLDETDEEFFGERSEDIHNCIFIVFLLQCITLYQPYAVFWVALQPFLCHACHKRVKLNACALARKILAYPPCQHSPLAATNIHEMVIGGELRVLKELVEVPITGGCVVIPAFDVGIPPAGKVITAYPPVVNAIYDANNPIGYIHVNKAWTFDVL